MIKQKKKKGKNDKQKIQSADFPWEAGRGRAGGGVRIAGSRLTVGEAGAAELVMG